MFAYQFSGSSFKLLRSRSVISFSAVVDSLETEKSSATVLGSDAADASVGDWLALDGSLYAITAAKPKDGSTDLTLSSPVDVFARPLPLAEIQPQRETIGGFISAALEQHYIRQQDPAYAMPFLVVSDSDTTELALPEVDSNGFFKLSDYMRLVRSAYGVAVRFRPVGGPVICEIDAESYSLSRISMQDGTSQIKAATFGAAGVAKVSVYQAGVRSDFYLDEDGTVSSFPPERRARGSWEVVQASAGDNPIDKALEAFGRGQTAQKIEFYSTRDLPVGGMVELDAYGQLVAAPITARIVSSADRRILYRAGSLKTTAAEKLKGVAR